MRRALLAIKQAANDMAFHHHALAHLCRRIGQECIENRARLACEVHQIVILGRTGGGDRHQSLAAEAWDQKRHYACTARKQSHKEIRLLGWRLSSAEHKSLRRNDSFRATTLPLGRMAVATGKTNPAACFPSTRSVHAFGSARLGSGTLRLCRAGNRTSSRRHL